MIKLKQLITESLKDMVFSKTIKPKHKKRMEMETKLFPDNPKLTIKPPPTNESNKTRSEVFYLLGYNDGVIDNEMVQAYDDIVKAYMPAVEKNGLKVSSDELEEIIKESSKFVMKLKYKFNRPRPKQVASYLEMDLPTTTLESMHTPSYPSGHSTQGIFIGKVLSKMYPNHEKKLMELGKMISKSRLMARAHYPSDSRFGEYLGELLFRNLK